MLDRITFIEVFTAALLAATALSHVLYPRLWAQLFIDMFHKPYAGLIIGALTLPLGLLIALCHNVWVWDLPVLVTIFGWGWTVKGTIYLLRPQTVQQVGARHMQHPERFRLIGGVMVAVAIVIMVDALVFRPLRMSVAPSQSSVLTVKSSA